MYKTTALTFSVQDARTIKLINTKGIHPQKDKNEIKSLYNTHGELIIESGQTLLVQNSKYRIDKIEQLEYNCYVLKSSQLNLSSIFITPLLWNNRSDMFWYNNFVNTFVGTPSYVECIAVLFKYSGKKEFTEFEKSIEMHPNYLITEDIDKYQVLYIFSVPDLIKDVYDKFVLGKYSTIPEHWKIHILNFHGYDNTGNTYKILYKSKKLRKKLEKHLDVSLKGMEVHSIPDFRIEKFNKNDYVIK
jgi:hypothetical protein